MTTPISSERIEEIRATNAENLQSISPGQSTWAIRDLLTAFDEMKGALGEVTHLSADLIKERDKLKQELVVERALNHPVMADLAILEERDRLAAEVEKCRTQLGDLHMEHGALRAEVAVARERLGPAGYKIIQEVSTLRAELAKYKAIAKAAERCLPPEAYWPKADGTALGDLRDALATLDAKQEGG